MGFLLLKFFFAESLLFFTGLGFYLWFMSHHLFAEDSIATSPTTALGALIAGFMAMTGLMVWIVKRQMDTVIPQMQETFKQSQANLLNAHEKINERQLLSNETTSSRHLEHNERQREMHRIEVKELTTAFLTGINDLRTYFEKKIDSVMVEARADRERMLSAVLDSQATLYNQMQDREVKK
jgi:hypothetical protein